MDFLSAEASILAAPGSRRHFTDSFQLPPQNGGRDPIPSYFSKSSLVVAANVPLSIRTR
jgi:hypothetical protein